LQKLNDHNKQQDENKESHKNLMGDLQKFILDFTGATEALRSEVSSLRTSTKNDIFAAQGAIEKMFLDAIANLPLPAPVTATAATNPVRLVTMPSMRGSSRGPTAQNSPREYSQDEALQVFNISAFCWFIHFFVCVRFLQIAYRRLRKDARCRKSLVIK
jgi:hypothetical protein